MCNVPNVMSDTTTSTERKKTKKYCLSLVAESQCGILSSQISIQRIVHTKYRAKNRQAVD